ncbi:Aspartate--tRNA ligase, mitochondrial [Portunus trituberculatus]|uniref:Aspartate--tRNA ligase, mitochondrial n=1 Tax=Portunus trituberculatus TaxID=210409 RepID=A0A5B7I4J2_PORTR|nr:Aspartate--tRNA ligase, mitochondrial [Portunus trituberculatus]
MTVTNKGRSSVKTHTCGELRDSHEGQQVILRGYLQYQRMGKFAIIRDAFGKTQVIIREEVSYSDCCWICEYPFK